MRFDPRLKLVTHPQFAAHMAGQRIVPVNVEISPSGVCNASCDFCFYANTGELGDHRKVFLTPQTLDELLRDCVEMGVKSVSWTGGGDPSLHPRIKDIIFTAKFKGLKQGMFTNALAEPKYDPTLLDWIRVTVTDKPWREKYIEMLRPCPTLGVAFNYAGSQDDELLYRALGMADRLKLDYVQVRPALKFHGQTVDIEPPKFYHPLMEVTWYKFEDAKKPHGYSACEGYHFVPFVWEDGNVDVCSYMRKHSGYTLGNLYNERFASIMARAPSSVPVVAQCQVCCRNHEHNKTIHEARTLQNREFP